MERLARRRSNPHVRHLGINPVDEPDTTASSLSWHAGAARSPWFATATAAAQHNPAEQLRFVVLFAVTEIAGAPGMPTGRPDATLDFERNEPRRNGVVERQRLCGWNRYPSPAQVGRRRHTAAGTGRASVASRRRQRQDPAAPASSTSTTSSTAVPIAVPAKRASLKDQNGFIAPSRDSVFAPSGCRSLANTRAKAGSVRLSAVGTSPAPSRRFPVASADCRAGNRRRDRRSQSSIPAGSTGTSARFWFRGRTGARSRSVCR